MSSMAWPRKPKPEVAATRMSPGTRIQRYRPLVHALLARAASRMDPRLGWVWGTRWRKARVGSRRMKHDTGRTVVAPLLPGLGGKAELRNLLQHVSGCRWTPKHKGPWMPRRLPETPWRGFPLAHGGVQALTLEETQPMASHSTRPRAAAYPPRRRTVAPGPRRIRERSAKRAGNERR